MELVYANEKNKINDKLVATIGMFDGVHLGHNKVLKKLEEEAKIENLKSCIITFKEHPDFVLHKNNLGCLTSFNEKIKLFSSYNIDYCLVFEFTKEFSMITHLEFENILKNDYSVIKLVLGNDTRYGYLGKGNIETLRKVFEVIVIDDYYLNGKCIHSTLIRELLSKGNIEEANFYLGRNYCVTGVVKKGSELGQKFNMRTANLELVNEYEFLKNGVYGVYVYLDNEKKLGICNIGHNPSFNYVKDKRLEVNIFDFDKDIYNKKIKVELIMYIRSEKTFANKEELYEQIDLDIKKVKEKMKI